MLNFVAVIFFVTVVFIVVEIVLIDVEPLIGVELKTMIDVVLAGVASTGVGVIVTDVVGQGRDVVVDSGSAGSSKPKSPPRIVRKTSIGSKPLRKSPSSLKKFLPSFLSFRVIVTSCAFSVPGAGARAWSAFCVSRR